MKKEERYHGSCLCGSVSVSANIKSKSVGACHCGMCQKWGGGPFFAVECGDQASFEGDENIAVFDSSEWAERGFCKRCGTHLFYRLKGEDYYAIPFALFEGHDDWEFSEQIFIEQKPTFYSFSEQTKNLTGEEVFAQYAASEE
ncbi:GFA family protein [Idiomarina abyssalis]|uniref:GFA family protein n=1 Tax=Idiomarina abyssalis TaxID=86102 RepID=UPI001CD79874|nr:GFA family protein [Idiomarina abyssalis]